MQANPRSCTRRRDAAVSDLIGNVLLVGLTVTLMAGAGLLLVTMAEPSETLNAQTRVRATSDTLTITHAGGEPLRLGGAVLVVTVDGTQQRLAMTDCPITPTGEPGYWEYAETLTITSPSAGCADWSGQQLTSAQLVFMGQQDTGSLLAAWDGSVAGGAASGQPQDPTADFTHDCTELECSFTDTSTDPDGTIQSWNWDFGGDGTSTQQHPTHTFSSEGTYDVKLKVTDDTGATDNHHANITVSTTPNSPPTADFTFTPSSPETDETITFDASPSSDLDGSIASYAWDWTNDGTFDDTGQSATHSYAAADTYTVRLQVTDDDGATDTTTMDVTVTASASDPMHVHDIAHAEGAGPPADKDLIATVTIYDGSEAPLASVDACVEITRSSDGATFTDCGATDGNGEATITWVGAGRDTYTTCVTSLTLSGFTWDTGADHASSGNCHTA